MTLKEHLLLPLFEKFIKDSYKGRRLKTDGTRIKIQSIQNYEYTIRYLKEYEAKFEIALRIKVFVSTNKRIFMAERKYWKSFYQAFTNFLYNKKIVSIIL